MNPVIRSYPGPSRSCVARAAGARCRAASGQVSEAANDVAVVVHVFPVSRERREVSS
jgi:hypothetical protein